jgi:hypothetical protein
MHDAARPVLVLAAQQQLACGRHGHHHGEVLEIKRQILAGPAAVGGAAPVAPDVHEAGAQDPGRVDDLPGLDLARRPHVGSASAL